MTGIRKGRPQGTDPAARTVQTAGGVLAAAPAEGAVGVGEPEQEAELLDAEVGANQVW